MGHKAPHGCAIAPRWGFFAPDGRVRRKSCASIRGDDNFSEITINQAGCSRNAVRRIDRSSFANRMCSGDRPGWGRISNGVAVTLVTRRSSSWIRGPESSCVRGFVGVGAGGSGSVSVLGGFGVRGVVDSWPRMFVGSCVRVFVHPNISTESVAITAVFRRWRVMCPLYNIAMTRSPRSNKPTRPGHAPPSRPRRNRASAWARLTVVVVAALVVGGVSCLACAPAPSLRRVVVVGDSRLVGDPARTIGAIESTAAGWDVVGFLAEPGSTVDVSPCESNPVFSASCVNEVLVRKHSKIARAVARTDVDAVVFVFGPNDISAVRGDAPPTWDSHAVPINTVKAGWEANLKSTKACWRLWATQQSTTWTHTAPGNPWAAYTSDIASSLNRWVSERSTAGRLSVVGWGATADANIVRWWNDPTAGSNLWFDRSKNDPQHPLSDGWGPVAEGIKIGEALNVLPARCHAR